MKINIVHGDIFSIPCDAFVNPTDIHLSGSGGLDRLIHLRGGEAIEQECAALRDQMKPGSTMITSGGQLPVKYILHTACPKCENEADGSYELLANCYRDMLSKAASKSDLHHLALPLVGTGFAGYTLHTPFYADSIYGLAAVTILSTIAQVKQKNLHTVTIVCSSAEKYHIMKNTFKWMFGRGISKRSRIRGSLLGGAIGDALGYPVEFNDAANSRIREYKLDSKTGVALISDDTQMTLFTACGLLWCYSRGCMKGIVGDLWHYIAIAYEDWLKTQQPDYKKQKPAVSWIRNIPQLNARRAPGITCISALEAGGGSIDKPLNDSKGCGGVMRIAPIALYCGAQHHWDQRYNLKCCAETAAITHGHPLGWLSAAALGNILYDIMLNFSIPYAVQDTIQLLRREFSNYPDTEKMVALLQLASNLANMNGYTSSVDLIAEFDISKQLGEGWVGEEALAIGLFCAIIGVGRGFDQCLWNAVGHKGDSDSTASIAGQIWGAYFGEEAISDKWLKNLELRDVITEIADDLTNDCRMSEYTTYIDTAWLRKYLSGMDGTHIPRPGEYPHHRCIQVPWDDNGTNSRVVNKWDIHGELIGQYEVTIEGGTIYHVAKNKEDAHTGWPGFGFVSLEYNEAKQAYTEKHGWVKIYPGGTVDGNYCNTPFTLIPNHANKCIEIFSPTTPFPWVGTISRRFDEWNNPIEFEFRDSMSVIPTHPLEIIISSSEYLRDFFE